MGKKTGSKAALWGAVCGTIPDLDVLAGIFMNDLDKNLFHRSISHSLLFFLIFSPPTGWILSKIYPNSRASFLNWTQLAFWSYFTHALLDSFTTWGTQLFWPWEYKIAFKSIFVIDPLYTIPLMILLILALKKDQNDPKRGILNWTGIIVSSLYLVLTLINKQLIFKDFKNEASRQDISILNIETKPAPLNNILWTATIEDSLGYYIGYKSFLDKGSEIDFEYFPKNHDLTSSINDNSEVIKIIDLTEGWYTVEKMPNGFRINDLRFGTNTAWKHDGDFVFSYEVNLKDPQRIIISQGEKTFKEKPKAILVNLAKRIAGI